MHTLYIQMPHFQKCVFFEDFSENDSLNFNKLIFIKEFLDIIFLVQ